MKKEGILVIENYLSQLRTIAEEIEFELPEAMKEEIKVLSSLKEIYDKFGGNNYYYPIMSSFWELINKIEEDIDYLKGRGRNGIRKEII